jgi:hypothetical protein
MMGCWQRAMGFGCKFSFYDREPQLLEDDLDYFAKPRMMKRVMLAKKKKYPK